MKIVKFRDKFYKLVEHIKTDDRNIEYWLTDFNDTVYLYKNGLFSLDNDRFYKSEVISTEPEVGDLFFKTKGN